MGAVDHATGTDSLTDDTSPSTARSIAVAAGMMGKYCSNIHHRANTNTVCTWTRTQTHTYTDTRLIKLMHTHVNNNWRVYCTSCKQKAHHKPHKSSFFYRSQTSQPRSLSSPLTYCDAATRCLARGLVGCVCVGGRCARARALLLTVTVTCRMHMVCII